MAIQTGITIGDKHTLKDWHLILTKMKIGHPEPKTSYISVPGRDGSIDATEYLMDMPIFENRELEFDFVLNKAIPKMEWELWRSKLLNAVHGRRLPVTLDSTPSWYYMGRVTVESKDDDGTALSLAVKVCADPFQYGKEGSKGNWKWDEFSFIDGSVYQHDFEVEAGTTVIRVPNCRMAVVPTIYADHEMSVKYRGSTYRVQRNTKTVNPAILLKEGYNEFEITATEKTKINIDFAIGKL